MIDLYIVGEDLYIDIINAEVQSNFYVHYINENSFKGKKEAHKLKNMYGAKLSPFALIKVEGKPIKAFYSEDKSCNLDNIINFIVENYDSKSSKINK